MDPHSNPRSRTVRPAPGRKLGLHQPPGKVFNGLVLAAAAALAWAASYPLFHFGYAAIAVLMWLGLAAVWFVRGVFLAWYSMAGRLGPVHRSRRFLYAPMMVLAAVVISFVSIPLHVRFTLSRPFLSDAATDASIGAVVDRQPIGLYQIDQVELFGDAAVFTTAAGGFLASGGFAHLPDGPGAPDVADWARHVALRSLSGSWYTWVD
ncbi:MAG: hypothetical protein GY720_20465 [bacterium]|nr:hypothetical protein [bacterium]